MGRVCIVSAASLEWIDTVVRHCVPQLESAFKDVTIESARDAYAHVSPSDPASWKMNSMRYILELHPFVPTQIVSIGDSEQERAAAWNLSSLLPGLTIKSIKLFEKPSIQDLERQIEMLHVNIDSIVLHRGPIDYHMRAVWVETRE
jgi:hypothetical protein